MLRYGLLAFGSCREIGHHGNKVKIGERPNRSSGNRSTKRDNGFESQRRTMSELAAQRTNEAKALATLKVEKATVDGEHRKIEADLGPGFERDGTTAINRVLRRRRAASGRSGG